MKVAWARLLGALQAIPAELRLLIGIFAVLVPMRIVHTAGVREMGVDGGYYVEVARHVRDGLGLSSHVALYHAGYEQFPHPTSIYPLWPLLLGYLARLGDLASLAHWLPLTLSFTALGAAFLFGRRLWPEPLLPGLIPGFNAGHLLVLLLGLQRDFLVFTSVPYTEALSWTLLLLFLWRLFGARQRAGWALELGVWSCLIYFCRAQLIIVPVAAILASALPVLTGPDRVRALGRLGITSGVIVAALGAWWLRLRGFVHEANLGSLLRFDQNRANDLLQPFDVIVEHATLGELLLDRADGLLVAWDPLSVESYQAVFYASHWALPLALPFLALAGWRAWREKGLSGLLSALRGDAGVAWALLLLLSAGGLASIHLAHKHFNGEWYFDRRQSMICALPFFLAMGYLLRQPGRLPVLLGGALLATSTTLGARALLHQMSAEEGRLRDDNRYSEIVTWLRRQSEDAPLVVAMQTGKVQRVGWRTSRVGYHWFDDETSYADLLTMTDTLGATYVMYSEELTRGWRFRSEGAGSLKRDFETLPDRPDNLSILRRRDAPPGPPARTPKVVVVGVDGADWKVMGPMIARGELPNFERLSVEGSSDLDLDTLERTASPVIWTSVATGREPEVHGVMDYTITLPDVGKVPITSDVRKVPALWNLASDAGLRVLTINWWASWPSEPVNGQVVSDHANPAAAGWMEGRYWQADPAALAALNKDTWPPELASQLAPLWIDPDAFPLAEAVARGQLLPHQVPLLASAPYNVRETWSWYKTFYAVDRPHHAFALREIVRDQPDLTMLYLRGPDPVQHYAWDTVEPTRYYAPPATLERDRGVVQSVYRTVDSYLGELMAALGPDTLLIVLSDHGAEPAAGAKRKGFEGRPGAHTQDAKGVLFLWGADVRRGVSLGSAGVLDIAPTIAWALGLPVAEDLGGRVLAEAFSYDFQERRGRVRVETWGTRAVEGSSTASPADENMLEQLRGLGYIE